MCHSRSAPLSASAPIATSSTARTASALSITLRRSWRSLTTPPSKSSAISGIVIAMPISDSAVGALLSVYACQATATRKAPSPSSDTQRPMNSRRKSRCASSARGPAFRDLPISVSVESGSRGAGGAPPAWSRPS
jgi:hypothetical protein